MEQSQPRPHVEREDRVRRFLAREPLLNFHIASTLAHERSTVIGLAESGEALVGVAVAGRSSAKEPPIVRLDAIGPVAVRRLLATLDSQPQRLMLHRPWLAGALEPTLGPLRVRGGVELYAGNEEDVLPPVDERARALTPRDIAALQARAPRWILDVLANHLSRGWQVFGIFEADALVAHACAGYPTNGYEEISYVGTEPAFRGRGLAGAVVGAAIAAVRARGRRPVYFSRSANLASRRVAERCGLRHATTMHEVGSVGQ